MTHEISVPVITIDGPSGTGKGTISQMLAAHLGWHFLDSGAIYRVLGFAATQQGIDLNDVEQLVSLAQALDLRFLVDSDQKNTVLLSGVDVSAAIRTEESGQNASKIAVIPRVRDALLQRQRAFATAPGLVTDGRDMGTIVFPKASLKIYLDANTQERASRRFLQLKESGNDASLAQVVDELVQRDARDTARTHAPLKPAEDAVRLDTTGLSIVQVFGVVLQLATQRGLCI
jgi:cytidylate kinase